MTTGFFELNSTGRVTRVVTSGTSPNIARSLPMTRSSASLGLLLGSSSTLNRAECSPSSERFMLVVSKPYITSNVSMPSASLFFTILFSTPSRMAIVWSSGVPTGREASKVNSLWCTSGSSSVSSCRPTHQVSAKQPMINATIMPGLANAQRMSLG